jgi:mRNA interferase MazF
MTKNFPQRGEVWLVCLDPTVGSEMKKTRPCVIIQNDIGNQYAATTIIAPVTSTQIQTPVVIEVNKTLTNGLSNKSYINTAQIRAIDKQRLIRKLGQLESNTMQELAKALRISLAL